MAEARYMRSAYWIGAPFSGKDEQFRNAIDAEVAPAFRRLPGVLAMRVLWPEKADEGAPAIACQFLLEFADRSDVEVMRASPERAAMGPRLQEVMKMFEGSIRHIEFAVA